MTFQITQEWVKLHYPNKIIHTVPNGFVIDKDQNGVGAGDIFLPQSAESEQQIPIKILTRQRNPLALLWEGAVSDPLVYLKDQLLTHWLDVERRHGKLYAAGIYFAEGVTVALGAGLFIALAPEIAAFLSLNIIRASLTTLALNSGVHHGLTSYKNFSSGNKEAGWKEIGATGRDLSLALWTGAGLLRNIKAGVPAVVIKPSVPNLRVVTSSTSTPASLPAKVISMPPRLINQGSVALKAESQSIKSLIRLVKTEPEAIPVIKPLIKESLSTVGKPASNASSLATFAGITLIPNPDLSGYTDGVSPELSSYFQSRKKERMEEAQKIIQEQQRQRLCEEQGIICAPLQWISSPSTKKIQTSSETFPPKLDIQSNSGKGNDGSKPPDKVDANANDTAPDNLVPITFGRDEDTLGYELSQARNPEQKVKSAYRYIEQWAKESGQKLSDIEKSFINNKLAKMDVSALTFLNALKHESPMGFKVLLVYLRVIPTTSKLAENNKIKSALKQRARDTIDPTRLEDRSLSMWERYSRLTNKLAMEEEKEEWIKKIGNLPVAVWNALTHPLLTSHAFLYFLENIQ